MNSNLNIQKKQEMAAVSTILLERDNCEAGDEDFNLKPSEPADVTYLPTGEKFQVTEVNGRIGRLSNANTGQIISSPPLKSDDIFNKLIKCPIQRKADHYGRGEATKDIKLVIYDLIHPPHDWLKDDMGKYMEDKVVQKFIAESGFLEIWIVFLISDKSRAIKIYPYDQNSGK